MKTIFFCFALALLQDSCGESPKPVPAQPQPGREAMTVDGNRVGTLEKDGGTYQIRYPDNSRQRVSANEVILMPESTK